MLFLLKHMKKRLHSFLIAFGGTVFLLANLGAPVFAQSETVNVKPARNQIVAADTVPAIVNHTEKDGLVSFSSLLRPLRQIAGAPEPFYTYFWEFGDGHFSFEKDPQHVFPDTLLYNVRLFATNSYDDGKRPPTRPKPLKPGSSRPILASNTPVASPGEPSFFKSSGAIELKTNCMPKPGEDMMLVFGYQNKRENGIASLNGTLSILYNDKEFTKDNFVLSETRVYNGEQKTTFEKNSTFALKSTPVNEPFYGYISGPNDFRISNTVIDPEGTAMIREKMAAFKTGESWRFENLKAGDERFVFMQFQTTPDMIKDTNAVVKLTGLFVPDDPLAATESFTVELQIVASHDPNKMMLKNSRMNFRFTGKKKRLTYKVRFQNTGKGPAKKVDVGVAIAEVLDMESIKILDSKPKVVMADSAYLNQSSLDTLRGADSVHFLFQNIYLPGVQQKGVKDADSTMGYIEYEIGFKDKPKKLPFRSGAAIVFDKNEPIYTNRSIGKYKMGLSPGIIAGYGFPFENGSSPYTGQNNLYFGASIAPYAPHRYFLQAEVYMSTYAEKEYLIERTPGNGRIVPLENADGRREEFRLNYIDSTSVIKATTINIVPIQLRRNFNKFIGVGIGSLVSLSIDKQSLPSRQAFFESVKSPGTMRTMSESYDKIKSSFDDFQNTMFMDIQIGKVHVGPSIGFRYLYTLQDKGNRMITYATWKF